MSGDSAMTPQAPSQSKSTGKLGRNPFANKPLKVGVKKTTHAPNRAAIDKDLPGKAKESTAHEAPSDRIDYRNAARGVRYLIEGFFYELTIKVMRKLSDRVQA